MSFTNSAIKGSKVTLPSVEGGFGTLNILRDPPRSIHTTYKPKIGDTSKLAEWIDASGDRVCESINKFARGVNPMVSVSYSNYGTNGGQMRDVAGRSGGSSALGSGQAYLPYRTVRDGAFRPPIIPPEQLLPLSRLPRLPTAAYTNKGSDMVLNFEHQSKCSTDLRALRKELLRVGAAPRKTATIQESATEPTELKSSVLADPLSARVTTNKTDQSVYKLGIPSTPNRGIKTDEHTLYGKITVNNSRNIQGIRIDECIGNQPIRIQDRLKGTIPTNASGHAKENPDQYLGNQPITIQDRLRGAIPTNTSGHAKETADQYVGNQPIRIQDRLKGVLPTNISGGQKHTYIHKERALDRNRPLVSMEFNKSLAGVDLNATLQSRDYTLLPPRAPRGEFVNAGYTPR